MTPPEPFGDLAPWQTFLDCQKETLASLRPGARIGFVVNPAAEGPVSQLRTRLLVWAVNEAGLWAECLGFNGFQDAAGIDLLMVLSPESYSRLVENLTTNPFPGLSRDVTRGSTLIYYLKSRDDLSDLGYEDLFHSIGLTFAGACR
ncbi:MAG: hypothetical protein OEY85_15660 [Rhodospirillales bacterium]|nr:hypothetical protein [Rhodospirillales bacterium]